MTNNYHSQNQEAQIIERYFNGRVGSLLDIGCNDGQTFSNSYDLIQSGWKAELLDPSPIAFNLASKLHKDRKDVWVYNFGIGLNTGEYTFYESGAHIPHGEDVALVSTTNTVEMKRWQNIGVQFKTTKVVLKSWADFYNGAKYDFITIDAESADWDILQQIDLGAVGCECLCIEWNSSPILAKEYARYCLPFGLTEIHRNAENIIYAI